MSLPNPGRYLNRDLFGDPTEYSDLFPSDKPFVPLIGVSPLPRFQDPGDISDLFPESRPYLDPTLSDAAHPGGLADLSGPFARQKRELPALGYSPEQIGQLDQGLESLRQLDPRQRRDEFRKHLEMYRMMGMTESEVESLRKHLGIEVTTLEEAVQELPFYLKPFGQSMAADVNLAKSLAGGQAAIAEGYGEFVHKPLVHLGEGMRAKIDQTRAKSRELHPFIYMPPIGDVKAVVAARNWKKLNEWADIGRLPTFDEMGPEYFQTVMSELKQEMAPTQFRAAQKMLTYSFTNPRSSWFRRGAKVPILSTEFIAKHPVLATVPLILQAPEEYVEHQLTHPETWPVHAAIFLGGKYVINPATKAGLNWLNARFPLTVPLKEAWRWNKAYRAVRKFGKATPVSNEMVADFFMNLTNPDIMSRIPINTTNPETMMMLEALQRRFRGMSPEDFGHFRLFFEKNATGDLNLYVPKDLSTLRKFAYGTPAGAQVPGTPLLGGPGAFPGQAVGRGVVAPAAGAFDAATTGRIPGTVPPRITGPGEFGAGAAVAGTPSAPGPQPPTSEQMSGLLLTADTGYTADEISLSIRSGTTPEAVKQLRMLITDDEIIQMGLERTPEPTPTVQDALMMKPTSRVRLPWQGDLEGTVTNISDPQQIVVELDQGGEARIPAEQLKVIANPAKDSSTIPIPLMGEGIPLAGGGQPPAITGTPEFVEKWFQQGTVTDGLLVRYPHLAEKYGLQDRYMQAVARAKEEYMIQGKVDLAVASVTNPSTGDPIDVPAPRPPSPADPGEGAAPYTVPLNRYLLETAPQELTTIKNIKKSLPFQSGDESAIRRYIMAVEKAVAKHMPEKLPDLQANIRAYGSGKAKLSDIDAIYASGLHRGLAEIQFAEAKVATGLEDPLEAAQAHHRASVESALATNPESVADEVLVEYPDLADKYGRRDLGRETKRGLKALGYTETEILNLLPSERNRLLSNEVAAGNVTIMDDGQAYVSAFYEEVADPTNYKTERTQQDVEKAAKEDMDAAKNVAEQLRLDLGGEEGFLLLPSIAQFRAVSDAVLTRAKRVFIPTLSDIQRDVMGSVEKWRTDYNHAGLMVEWADADLRMAIENDNKFWDRLTPAGKQRRAAIQKNLAIVDDWMENPVVNQARLNALPSAWKSLATTLRDSYNNMHAYATSEGIELTWRENYSPGMYKNRPEKTLNTIYPGPGKLGQRISAQSPKKYANKMEARADGLDPIEDPIYKHAQYQLALHRVIANKKLVTTIMNMYDTNGVPYIMFEPIGSKTGVYRDAWKSYKRLDTIPGLKRLRFTATHDGIPILRIENVRAHPEAHAIITDVFDPYVRPNKWMRRYTYVRGLIKRGKMYNPMIHTWNVFSDALDEMNFNPIKTVGVFREGSRMWNRQPGGVRQVIANGSPMWNTRKEAVELAVKSGLETATSLSAANDLRRQFRAMHPAAPSWMEPDSRLAKATTGGIKLWRDMIHTSDKFLWHNVVLYAQLGTWEEISHSIAKKHPDWDATKVARTASVYVNTLYGTLPHTWMKKGVRKFGNHIFFARNWTFANLNLAAYTVTGARRGLGSRYLEPDEQTEIFKRSGLHLIKGFIGLLATAALLQQGIMRVKNQLSKDGIIDDPIEKPRWPWENEPGKHFDVYVGKNNKGQAIYYVPGLFRYFRDYEGWVTKPRHTFFNKMHPLPKAVYEGLGNYEHWRKREIWDEDASPSEQLKQGLLYFVRSATPIEQFGLAGQPGRVQTTREWIAPFLGMWVRRGAPGGKYTGLFFEYKDEKQLWKDKLDDQIDEAAQDLDNVDTSDLFTLLDKRYKDADQKVLRLFRYIAPLNYYWDTASKAEKLEFQLWLAGKGEDLTDFHLARATELNNLLDRALNDVEDDTMTLDDMKREKLEEELLQRQGQLPPEQQGGDDDLLQMLQQFGTQ